MTLPQNAKPDGTLATKPASVLEVRIDTMCVSVDGVNIGSLQEVNFIESYVISTRTGKHTGKIQVWTQLADIYPEVQRALASGCTI